MDDATLIDHLLRARLAGDVSTTVKNTRSKIEGLFGGDPRCDFGISACSSADSKEIDHALLRTAGTRLVDDELPCTIDPRKTLAGIEMHARVFAEHLRTGSSVLLATGHPGGLLEHYVRLGAELERAGASLLRPLDGGPVIETGLDIEPPSSVRFIGGVACVYRAPGSLAHSHLPHYMAAMLDELARRGSAIELVIADHGMAGVALERGIPTLSIADVNDIPLLLVSEQEDHALLVLDDNRPPAVFRPIPDSILERAGARVR